jgi:hypothetical protein
MKVKIRVERGWIEAPASATVSPELFVTPFVSERRGKNGRPYHYFSRRQFVVTHRRTGMTAMSDRVSKRMAIFAARLLGETGIPWERLNGPTARYKKPVFLTKLDGERVWVVRVLNSRASRRTQRAAFGA